MSKDIDEILIETNKLESELAETKHQLEIEKKWNDILYKALHLVCERMSAAVDVAFFDKDEEVRKDIVRNMATDFALLAQKGEYEPRHK